MGPAARRPGQGAGARPRLRGLAAVSERVLPFRVIVLFILLFIPALRGTLIVDYVVLLVLVVVIGEGWYTGRKVMRLAVQRCPGESTRGVRLYAAMRNT